MTVPLNLGTCSKVRAFAAVNIIAEKVLPRNRATTESQRFGRFAQAKMKREAKAASQSIMGFLSKRVTRRPQIRVPEMKKTEKPMTMGED